MVFIDTVLFHSAVSAAGGLITVFLAYVIFRKKAVSFWGWISSFFPDMPVFVLVPLGIANPGNVLLASHTVGILIFPIFLVIIDILLIEVAWLRYISWLPYPRFMKNVKRVESWVGTLERYNAIPRPAKVKRVYLVGILAGIIHLLINLMVGSL